MGPLPRRRRSDEAPPTLRDFTSVVRAWSAELLRRLPGAGELTCLSMHPSGLHLLVGLTDKIRFVNILADAQGRGIGGLRVAKEWAITNTRDVCRGRAGSRCTGKRGEGRKVEGRNTTALLGASKCQYGRRNENGKIRRSRDRRWREGKMDVQEARLRCTECPRSLPVPACLTQARHTAIH